MTGNRLYWPEWFCRLVKMDAYGNLPRWWQWLFPRYGNWGCPGWSAGRWNPSETDWQYPPTNGMDELFMWHDWDYQHGFDRDVADHNLVVDLRRLSVTGTYARFYRVGAIVCFTAWPRIRSAYWRILDMWKFQLRTAWFVLLVAAIIAAVSWGFAGAADVPAITPADFGGTPAASAQEAHWIWQLLITDTASRAVEWVLTVGVYTLLGWLGLHGTRLGQCVIYIAAGVKAMYGTFVRPAKQKSANGKLSEADRAEAMRLALDYAAKLANAKGFELFKYLSKDVASAIGELWVRIFKGGGKTTEILVPLENSPPLPPSVTEGARPA